MRGDRVDNDFRLTIFLGKLNADFNVRAFRVAVNCLTDVMQKSRSAAHLAVAFDTFDSRVVAEGVTPAADRKRPP